MTIFVVVAGILFLGLSVMRLRFAFLAFIGLLPLMPAYIAFPIGASGAGVSLRRVLTYCLAVAILQKMLTNYAVWKPVLVKLLQFRLFFVAIVGIYLSKLFSTLYLNEPVGLVYLLDEFVELMVVLLLAIRYLNSIPAIKTVFAIVTASLFASVILVIIEYQLQHNLLQNLIVVKVSTVGEDVLYGFEREGAYRVMSLFDNPLSLAEFLCFGTTFAIAAYHFGNNKLFSIFALLLSIPAVLLTGSRSGIVVYFILACTIIYWRALLNIKLLRSISGAIIIVLLIILFLILYLAILEPVFFLQKILSHFGDTIIDSSSLARLSQYPLVVMKVLDENWYGYGMKNRFIEDIGIPLDNYLLRVMIEGGIISLFFYAVLISSIMHKALTQSYTCNLAYFYKNKLKEFFLLFFCVFIGYKFFISMSFNNVYFFIVSGMVIALSYRRKSGFSNKIANQQNWIAN